MHHLVGVSDMLGMVDCVFYLTCLQCWIAGKMLLIWNGDMNLQFSMNAIVCL